MGAKNPIAPCMLPPPMMVPQRSQCQKVVFILSGKSTNGRRSISPDQSVFTGRACAVVRSHVKAQGKDIRSLASRVSMKLEESDLIKGAVRIACSEDTIVDCSDETFTTMQSKHLHPH